MATYTAIIETSANQLFAVRDSGSSDLAHVWFGLPVKRKGGSFVPKASARETLVRKAAFRVVSASSFSLG